MKTYNIDQLLSVFRMIKKELRETHSDEVKVLMINRILESNGILCEKERYAKPHAIVSKEVAEAFGMDTLPRELVTIV